MEVLVVKVSAPLVSFRRPLDHNYQRTLLLPPPTTMLGLAGAAFGLSDTELWRKEGLTRELFVAAFSSNEPGRAKDRWTVMKIKGAKITERSPYFRELLFFASFSLIYGGSPELLSKLKEAFLGPVYPLSLGREDELIYIESAKITHVEAGTPLFQGTVIPGDLKKMNISKNLREGMRFEPPTVETLPLGFYVTNGERGPENPISLSFISHSLEIEVRDIEEVYSLEGRNFTWMNSLRNRTSPS